MPEFSRTWALLAGALRPHTGDATAVARPDPATSRQRAGHGDIARAFALVFGLVACTHSSAAGPAVVVLPDAGDIAEVDSGLDAAVGSDVGGDMAVGGDLPTADQWERLARPTCSQAVSATCMNLYVWGNAWPPPPRRAAICLTSPWASAKAMYLATTMVTRALLQSKRSPPRQMECLAWVEMSSNS